MARSLSKKVSAATWKRRVCSMVVSGRLRQELWHFPPSLGIIFTMSQSLWNFSLAAYANKAVQDECLALQDEFGLDVNLILLCSYLGAVHGVTLTAEATAPAPG